MSKLTIREITFCSLMAALTYISSFISLPLGPVPFTLQTLFVLLTGLILPKRAAVTAQVLHLFLILIFKGFQSFLSPSFGFVLGFIIGAYVMAWFLESRGFTTKSAIGALLIGSSIFYLFGLPYMALIVRGYLHLTMSTSLILKTGFLLFIPGDILKAVFAFLIGSRLQPFVRRLPN
ncbi:biotin transporter BioY [Carnobacterium viridans]|uniref:Biotin transporter n=1 Tax=Carnobacterium viridans TaxID=174587 RepID=A0A1H1AET7_9LACT|nr:biotin transporter BioY [Carnobacterium viridans]UDE96219.1 biotin transporter BioY [Carnobacterium viridans]SDQ38213.1 biotin transport system substrate-specific component [Carnobacterium viridans]